MPALCSEQTKGTEDSLVETKPHPEMLGSRWRNQGQPPPPPPTGVSGKQGWADSSPLSCITKCSCPEQTALLVLQRRKRLWRGSGPPKALCSRATTNHPVKAIRSLWTSESRTSSLSVSDLRKHLLKHRWLILCFPISGVCCTSPSKLP